MSSLVWTVFADFQIRQTSTLTNLRLFSACQWVTDYLYPHASNTFILVNAEHEFGKWDSRDTC